MLKCSSDFAMVAKMGPVVKVVKKAVFRQALRCKMNSLKFARLKPNYYQGISFNESYGKIPHNKAMAMGVRVTCGCYAIVLLPLDCALYIFCDLWFLLHPPSLPPPPHLKIFIPWYHFILMKNKVWWDSCSRLLCWLIPTLVQGSKLGWKSFGRIRVQDCYADWFQPWFRAQNWAEKVSHHFLSCPIHA